MRSRTDVSLVVAALAIIVHQDRCVAAHRPGASPGLHAAMRSRIARRSSPIAAEDGALMASLRKRLAQDAGGESLAPRGPDEVSAAKLGPQAVVEYGMRALALERWDLLIDFSQPVEGGKFTDSTGRIVPGAFSHERYLVAYAREQKRYAPLTAFDKWELDGSVQTSDSGRQAMQLVRIHSKGAGEEQGAWSTVEFRLLRVPYKEVNRRWLITSVDMPAVE
jgi:hypothetical protein